MRSLVYAFVVAGLTLATASTSPAQPTQDLVSLVLKGQQIDGLPLAWSPRGAMVLGKYGRLWQFDPADVQRSSAYAAPFTPASHMELKSQLYAEFGRQFTITSTAHYIVAHPTYGRNWPQILEKLHRSFLSFCTLRKITVRKGKFPMVAIVFPDRGSFMRYAERDQGVVSNALGYYSKLSNRVALYDHGSSSGGVSSTIRHEAAHQSAFNSGVHLRVGETPLWIIEGIGTLFEADGFYDSSQNRTVRDRVAKMYQDNLLRHYPSAQSLQSAMERLIADDRAFKVAQEQAYAMSWAMTFYLAERRPDVLKRLIDKYTVREPFKQYQSGERLRDFAAATGMSPPMFATSVYNYVRSVR